MTEEQPRVAGGWTLDFDFDLDLDFALGVGSDARVI